MSHPLDGLGDISLRGWYHQTLSHLGKLGSNIEWNLTLAGDTLGLVFGIDGPGKLFDETLGSRVLGKKGKRVHGRSRGEIDDCSSFTLHHTGQDESGHPNGTINVHCHEVLDFVICQFMEEYGVSVTNSDIVDQNTDLQIFELLGNLSLSSLVEFRVITYQIRDFNIGIFRFNLLLDILEF